METESIPTLWAKVCELWPEAVGIPIDSGVPGLAMSYRLSYEHGQWQMRNQHGQPVFGTPPEIAHALIRDWCWGQLPGCFWSESFKLFTILEMGEYNETDRIAKAPTLTQALLLAVIARKEKQ